MGVLPQPTANCDSLVLRAWPCGESSVIASLLTRDHGYVKVIAKAARRANSRLRALVEPGRVVAAEFSLDPRRELQFLRGGSVDQAPLGPGSSLEQSIFLQAALELVDRCRPIAVGISGQADHQPAAALFGICESFIRVLSSPSCQRPDLAFFGFEWELLVCHGMAPEVAGCTGCGEPASGLPATSLWFSPVEGGMICGTCAGGEGVSCGRPLSREALAILARLADGRIDFADAPPFERPLRREIGAHLHNFLGYHLPGYRLPAALELLRARKDTTR